MNITKRSFVLTCPAGGTTATTSASSSSSYCIIQGSGNHRLIRIGIASYVSFYNIHFTNGYSGFGGGVAVRGNSNTAVTFINCLFTNNTAIDAGGALYIDSTATATKTNTTARTTITTTSALIENCNFTNNHADLGGAIYSIVTPNIQIKNTNFQMNQADTVRLLTRPERASNCQMNGRFSNVS